MEESLHLYKEMNMFIPKEYYIFDVMLGLVFFSLVMVPFTLHFEHYIFLLLNKLMAMRGNEIDPWN